MKSIEISLSVNGNNINRRVEAGKTLLEFLRSDLD